MPDVRVALASTMRTGRLLYGFESLGLELISKALAERGFEHVQSFPLAGNRDKTYRSSAARMAMFLEGSEIPVIGISVTSDMYPEYLDFLDGAKTRMKNAIYVGGGVHFAREAWHEDGAKDSIELELEPGRIDAAVYGHCNAFIEFCEGLRDGSIKWNGQIEGELPAGMYAAYDGKVRGSGMSGLPGTKMPVAISGWNGELRLTVAERLSCPNGCDYCTCLGGNVETDSRHVGEIREAVSAAMESGKIARVSVIDNNPLAYGRSLGYLRLLRDHGINVPASIFVDDSMFAGDGWEHLLEKCIELGITGLFAGRETPSAMVAGKMGRMITGRARTQDFLDASGEGMMRFKEAARKCGKVEKLVVSYICSPFEDYTSARRMADEIGMLEADDPAGMVRVVCNALTPYFGTKLRMRCRDMIIGRDNPLLLNSDTVAWDPGGNMGAHNFMCAVNDSSSDPGSIEDQRHMNEFRYSVAMGGIVDDSFRHGQKYPSPFTVSKHPRIIGACVPFAGNAHA